ncbi:MAG: sulfatase [Chloroflexota bacterium]
MSKELSRRDFLKLISACAVGSLAHGSLSPLGIQDGRPNVIIVLFDAMSAIHMSLHGYARETTPHMSRLADRATVYHNHYAAGNFTTSGTASMLTGMFPWKHRAFNQGGLIRADLRQNNFYTLLGEGYERLAFSQNPWPDRLFSQFYHDVDRFLPITSYSLRGNKLVSDKIGQDRYLASLAFEEFLFTLNADVMGSSVLGYLYKSTALDAILSSRDQVGYPRGAPEIEGYTTYRNEDVYRGVFREIMSLEAAGGPYFAYFHLFSPHFPYKPGKKYWKLFQDGFEPPSKPAHPLSPQLAADDVLSKRTLYDQQVAHVDAEFGALMDRLEAEGVLENSYVIATSDHGEMFERGFYGHGGVFLYEPVIKIPLLVFSPGQRRRQDVTTPTSNVDILPTVLSLAGNDAPAILDGRLLPGLGGERDEQRPLFSIYAAQNSVFSPLQKAAIVMRKGAYKLIAYFGYPGLDNVYELYHLEGDPEELHSLVDDEPLVFSALEEELLDHLADANRPYQAG